MSQKNKLGYEDSSELESMTDFLLKSMPQEFEDALNTKFKIFYTDRDPSQRHFAGFCRKLDPAVQHRTGFQYFIVIYKPAFQEYSIEQKFLVLIHELHHIFLEENEETQRKSWKVRRHNEEEDFCELPSHDEYSMKVYARLKAKSKELLPELTS